MADVAETQSEERPGGIGFFGLVGLVVSSCIGTGVFALTGQLAAVASPGGVLVSWLIVGVGFLMLAFSLNNLVVKKPRLSSIYAYAQEGFGPFTGFISGWGYWLSAWLGNVAFATILASTIGYFFPYFLPGNNIGSILMGSIINWVLVALIIRGVESASFLNALIMVVRLRRLPCSSCSAPSASVRASSRPTSGATSTTTPSPPGPRARVPSRLAASPRRSRTASSQ